MKHEVQEEKLRNLLRSTEVLIDKNEQLLRARKENFNLFTILNVERR